MKLDDILLTEVVAEEDAPNKNERYIGVTYDLITPESAENGDVEESGWEDEHVSMEPDEWDVEDGITAVDKAVEYIQDNGGVQNNGDGSWYSTVDPSGTRDYYEKGEEVYYSFHLNNFSDDEMNEIADRIG